MRLNIEKVLKNEGESLSFEYPLDLSTYEIWGEFPFKEPISVTGNIVNRAGMIVLTTRADVRYDTVCARCLKELSREITLTTENYVVSEKQSEDDDRLILAEGNELDLDEIVGSNILLNMPIRELCKADCKGLCPKCGIDLNYNTCDCDKKEVDPRLAILKTLL